MRHRYFFLVLVGLAGCGPDQAKDVAACQSEADRFYPTYRANDLREPSSQYIVACMGAKGYDFTIVPTDCDSRRPLPTQATCYTPSHWFAGMLDRFRRMVQFH
jgi:hypothetical protein